MKRKFNFGILIAGVLFLTLTAPPISAQKKVQKGIPEVINFDGVIVDANGKVIKTGTYDFTFSLYTASDKAAPVWTESQKNVEVNDGAISVKLGSVNPLNVKFNRDYYLGIKIGMKPEMNPRLPLTSVPYAERTKIAEEVPDASITQEKIADNAIADEKIKSVDYKKITGISEAENDANADKELPDYWRRHGNYLDTGKEWLGTINDRNLVVRTDSVQRMLIDPYGKIIMGTEQDSVFFEVIGKTTLCDVYVKNFMGVGVDFADTKAKLHINSKGTMQPFVVAYDGDPVFEVLSNRRVQTKSVLTGDEDDVAGYPFYINGGDQGVAVKISGSSNGSHNYVSFWNHDGMKGRIEGQNAGEYLADPINIAHDVWLGAIITAGVVAAALEALEAPDIVALGAEIIYWTFENAWNLFHLGVTYESGSGDYAEWLEKINPQESFGIGDIVGVYGGKISKQTKGADKIMTVSTSPVVLGNMPPKEKEVFYEKVAFKGQVPVKVSGKVNKGDYVIPSGLNDGIGIAVSPEMMTAEEYAKTIGKAWASSQSESVKLVNVAVGMNLRDLAVAVQRSFNRNKALQKLLNEKNKEILSAANDISALKSDLENGNRKLNAVENAVRAAKMSERQNDSNFKIQTAGSK
ncbi:MAG: hypothetical protein GXO87_05385 [Chlorobi bacterium]|nr:hypothetical protein [Chlorobiota bacterium]